MVDSHAFRHAMSLFATGICVVTTRDSDGQAVGLTVNSLASVSLQPTLILWNLSEHAECCAIFQASTHFTVNVLNKQQADLCRRYANKQTHTLLSEHYQSSASGGLLLRDALSSFECDVWARYPGGDHTIIVGEVQALHSVAQGEPLLFYAAQYD